MPSAEAPTSGRVISKVASASAPPRDFWPERPRSQLLLQLLLAAEQVLDRDAAVVEDDLGRVRGADAELGLLLALAQAGGVLADDEGGLAAGAERRVDGGDDDVDVGDAAVGDEDLGAVEDPLVAVALRRRLQALHVGAGLRLGHRVGAELDLVAAAEALGDPLGDLLGRAGGGDARGGEAGAGDRQGDAGAAPVELFGRDHLHLALGVAGRALDALEAAEALLARLLDHLPGDALLFVVLAGGGPDHLAGEGPAALLELLLLLVQCEIHWVPSWYAPLAVRLIDWSVNQSQED